MNIITEVNALLVEIARLVFMEKKSLTNLSLSNNNNKKM